MSSSGARIFSCQILLLLVLSVISRIQKNRITFEEVCGGNHNFFQ